jgi:RIO kinase 2
MRTMDGQDFRVLEAVEKGMLQHELVPAPLIASYASLRHGGCTKIVNGLLRDKLLSHDKSCGYDGYRITNAGYDILALHNLKVRGFIAGFGDRIGTGKESDVYLGVHPSGYQVVLKIHRLGRTSFRNVKKTRDYFQYNTNGSSGQGHGSQSNSWLFLNRKSALKEFAFMKALYDVDYPTPQPLAHNRHIVLMSLVRGVPLYQIHSKQLSSEQAASIFHQSSALALRLAQHGLVHCDLNEFNLLVDLSGIQHVALDTEHDPYVRHSGLSVAAESAPGMLSGRGPWEQEEVKQFAPDDGSHEEVPIVPAELLDNGEPKPKVTLIDFPQMVSTLHPNAKELYERDMACLHKFFTHKLHCHIPEEEESSLLLTWEDVQDLLKKQQSEQRLQVLEEDAVAGDDATVTQSVCLANREQLRLDQELQASGYTAADANRDMELYYYYQNGAPQQKNNKNKDGDAKEEENADIQDGNAKVEKEAGMQDGRENDDVDSLGSAGQGDGDSVINDTASQIFAPGQLADMSRQQLQELARVRVQEQLDAQKKKGRQRGAFRKQNSNKSYVKGKRVFADFGV